MEVGGWRKKFLTKNKIITENINETQMYIILRFLNCILNFEVGFLYEMKHDLEKQRENNFLSVFISTHIYISESQLWIEGTLVFLKCRVEV